MLCLNHFEGGSFDPTLEEKSEIQENYLVQNELNYDYVIAMALPYRCKATRPASMFTMVRTRI